MRLSAGRMPSRVLGMPTTGDQAVRGQPRTATHFLISPETGSIFTFTVPPPRNTYLTSQ